MWNKKKHNMIIRWVIGSYMGPMYFETPYICSHMCPMYIETPNITNYMLSTAPKSFFSFVFEK